MEKLLEVSDLHVAFPSKRETVRAVDGVSFQVFQGETFGLVGESGCGKSQTLRSILGLLKQPGRITGGEIRYKGADIAKMSQRELQKIRGKEISMIFQEPMSSLNPVYRIGDQMLEMIRTHNKQISKKDALDQCVEMLKRVGIPSPEKRLNQYPHEFSGGQQQRVGIARALAVKPEFIVCDEPISALDVSIQSQVVNMLEDMQEELGLTYLFIAHDLSVVRHISNRIGVMYLGSLVELGESYELNRNPIHPYTKTLLSAVPVPDPKLSRSRIVLEGDIPSPINPPSGCRFHTRCPYATEKCRQEMPKFKEHAPGHWAACHLLDQ